MLKKKVGLIFAIFILVAFLILPVSAEPCSFCEFINVTNITRGVTDHALLSNLSADNHPQYILTAGTRAFTGMQSLGGFNLTDLLDPVAPQDAATKNYVDRVNSSMQAYVDANPSVSDHGLLSNLSGDGHPQYILTTGMRAFTGMQSLGGFNLTDLLDPVAPQDAATKNYVDLVNISQTSSTGTAIALANTSMKNYVDLTNTSMTNYVNAVNTSQNNYASRGYSINIMALTSNPANNAVTYFGFLPAAPSTTAGLSKIYIRRAGTIKIAEVYSYSGTRAGTGETWGMRVRLNGATDYPVANLTQATNERIWSNTSINIPVAAGDYIQIKSVQPAWATTPQGTIYGGYIYIE